MITREQAMTASRFEHVTQRGADEQPVRARRNGATKTWKREPQRFRIPVKYGLKQCFYIEEQNANEWNEWVERGTLSPEGSAVRATARP